MSMWKARLAERLKSPSGSMHPFPCSALLACFGNTRENVPFDQPSAADTHPTICVQPMANAGGEEGTPEKRRPSCTCSERNGGANQNSSNHTAVQPAETPEDLPGSPEDGSDCEAVTFQTSIPRPSIIEMPTKQNSGKSMGAVIDIWGPEQVVSESTLHKSQVSKLDGVHQSRERMSQQPSPDLELQAGHPRFHPLKVCCCGHVSGC
ncbi:hypothetical protein CB1_001561006 [Camelus ferus]|nr:hypothetical protein CB1_001561006 [Camelus ferus]